MTTLIPNLPVIDGADILVKKVAQESIELSLAKLDIVYNDLVPMLHHKTYGEELLLHEHRLNDSTKRLREIADALEDLNTRIKNSINNDRGQN